MFPIERGVRIKRPRSKKRTVVEATVGGVLVAGIITFEAYHYTHTNLTPTQTPSASATSLGVDCKKRFTISNPTGTKIEMQLPGQTKPVKLDRDIGGGGWYLQSNPNKIFPQESDRFSMKVGTQTFDVFPYTDPPVACKT